MNTTTAQSEKQAKGMIFFSFDAMNAFKHAIKFKGKNGRLATLPDVVDAKIAADDNDAIWHQYIATKTAEYFGSSRGGNKILIVGHNVGPFADDERVVDGEFKQGFLELGRTEFRKLESGIYGPVEAFDLKDVCSDNSNDYFHLGTAKNLKLLKARLGPRTDEFLERHDKLSQKYLETTKERFTDNCIIQNAHDFSYKFLGFKRGNIKYDKNRVMYVRNCSSHKNLLRHGYYGYLITIDAPMVTHHSHNGWSATGVTSTVGSQKFSDAARFIAIRGEGKLEKLSEGIEGILDDVENNVELLMVPRDPKTTCVQPYTLTQVGDNWFTQYRDEHSVMESGLPECKVVSIKAIGEPTTFRTEILGYYGLFKYELDTVKKLLPDCANAFVMGEPHNVWENGDPKYQEAPITFFNVEINPTKRLLTPDEARKDWERILTTAGEI
ncbi:hypothetical protein HY485_05240 [Candidatus Woesearchaeota archaeon]|nr:hypothetical protein [Candidatus Woesearchaeota archaeon]